MLKRKNNLAFWVILPLFLLSSFCQAEDKIIAIVNKDIITQKDLNDFINFMRLQLMAEYKAEQLENKIQSIKSDLLERLIEDRLILQEAKKEDIKVDENRVKARINELKERYPSDTEFQESLKQQGLVQADLELKTREQLLMYSIVDTKIRSKIVVNPKEVTDFYEKHAQEFNVPQERAFELVSISDEKLAQEIYNQLKTGESLNNLGQKYSLNVNNLNCHQDGELKKEIEDAVFSLEQGETSQPLKIEDRFYIFKLNNIIPSKQKSLTEVQDQIQALLFNEKMEERLTLWLDELKKKSYIKILQG